MKKKLMVKHPFRYTRLVTVAVCLLGLSYGGIFTSPSEATYSRTVDIITKLQPYQSPSVKPLQSEGQLLEIAPLSTESESPTAALDQETFDAIADATVLQGYPSENTGATIDMWAGYDEYLDPDGEIARSLIQFDIASLPANQTITKAKLRVYLVSSWDYPDTSRTIRTYRILSGWSEGNVNWNNSPSYGDAYGSRSITSGAWDWYEFDVTSLVSGWYDGTYQNHGVMLRGPEVSGTDSSWRGFGTRESDYTPELVVEYTPSNTAPVISGLPDQELLMNSSSDNAIDLWAYANDIEDIDADLIFSISNTPAVSAGVTIDSNRYIDINPDSGWTGSTNVDIQVQDTGSLIDTDTFNVTVTGGSNIYLPLALKDYIGMGTAPAAPTLSPIDNPDGDGNYTVNWSTSNGATGYTLVEDDNATFSSPTTRYTGTSASWNATGKAPGTYYYRVKASNIWGDSEWSNVETVTVTVCPPFKTGTWEGKADFTVPSDRSRVVDFKFDAYCPPCPHRQVTAEELPIDNCRIKFSVSEGGVQIGGSGNFISETEMEGHFLVQTSTCLCFGTWRSTWVSNTGAP